MNNKFKDIRITDNFYQSSSFFPMPLTLIGTLNEDGSLTSYGAYSLIFPYYIAGKGFYAMVLECRNTSNTAKGLLRHGKCTINFLPYSKKNFAQHVDCGFPGDTPEEKMKNFRFTPVDGLSQEEHPRAIGLSSHRQKIPFGLPSPISMGNWHLRSDPQLHRQRHHLLSRML